MEGLGGRLQKGTRKFGRVMDILAHCLSCDGSRHVGYIKVSNICSSLDLNKTVKENAVPIYQ